MRTAVGGLSIFQIVILFVLLFTAIMCLTINHSKAFGVKDEIITIIQNEGLASANGSFEFDEGTRKKIANYLNDAGYRITGTCPTGYIAYERDGDKSASSKNASFCIRVNDVANMLKKDIQKKCGGCELATNDLPNMVYYDVVVFYQLDIPLLKDITNFRSKGSTKILYKE